MYVTVCCHYACQSGPAHLRPQLLTLDNLSVSLALQRADDVLRLVVELVVALHQCLVLASQPSVGLCKGGGRGGGGEERGGWMERMTYNANCTHLNMHVLTLKTPPIDEEEGVW